MTFAFTSAVEAFYVKHRQGALCSLAVFVSDHQKSTYNVICRGESHARGDARNVRSGVQQGVP